jgi:hypothetical protein
MFCANIWRATKLSTKHNKRLHAERWHTLLVVLQTLLPSGEAQAVRRFSGGFTQTVQSPMLTINVGLASMIDKSYQAVADS